MKLEYFRVSLGKKFLSDFKCIDDMSLDKLESGYKLINGGISTTYHNLLTI